ASNASKKQLSEMNKLLGSMQVQPAGEKYEGYRDFAIQDAHLHRLVADASGNPLITDALNRLHAHTHSYRLYFKIGITEETTQEHQLIFDMIVAREPEKAEAAMRDHITSSRDRLKAAYEDKA
ncbi:FadR/GntR family transcriptional regulator, partial [Kibdelosporangium lantanae]